jgi:uncharacterized protein (TIGR02646 family)
MIEIHKNRHEPLAWARKKATPGFTFYEPIPELREALLKDQGYICAYCMRSIPITKKDPNTAETSKIEHIKCREFNSGLQLDYNNMVICCPGNLNGEPHCDKSKDNADITFGLFSPSIQNSISYSSKSGEIRSSDPVWDSEIKTILNLNHKLLKYNRKEALDGVIIKLGKKNWTKAEIEKELERWETPDKNGKYKQYCGVIISFLKKRK